MVQISKANKKAVYRHLLQEGVIVFHKDFSDEAHKGTGVANINVRMLLKSLKDRGFVELIFNWQWFYYFLNANGKKYISEYLGLTEDVVVPLTWKADNRRQYQLIVQDKGRRIKREKRDDGQKGDAFRGGRGGRRQRKPEGQTPVQETTTVQVQQPTDQTQA